MSNNSAISAGTLADASAVKANANLVITQPDLAPVGIAGITLVGNGTAIFTANTSVPFSTISTTGSTSSFEVGNVTVSISGFSVRILSVTPTEITCLVIGGLPAGLADVIVTSREGFMSYSTAGIAGLEVRSDRCWRVDLLRK